MAHRGLWRVISLITSWLAVLVFSLAGCFSAKRDATQRAGGAAAPISLHLPFGNPSDASGDPNNRLVLRPQFVASWNASKRIPNWVAWRLVASDIGDAERHS